MRFLLWFLLCGVTVFAQKKNEAYQYHIREASSSIKVDGLEDDAAWQTTETAKDFFMITPMDTSQSRAKTEVKMCYDKNNLYIIAVNYKPVKGSLVVESLKRDFNFGNNDNFFIVLDTFEDLTNGFSFGASAAGAYWDGQEADGTFINLNWDNKWYGATKNYDDRWVWEASIPFKSIRYRPDQTRWGINFSRLELTINEKSAWAPVPRQFQSANLGYAGVLVWDKPLPPAGKNISIIPYALTGVSKDFVSKKPTDWRPNIGGDAKIALNSSMNLDLTVNPDFSQVEVDVQQTNLDRFELFFPNDGSSFWKMPICLPVLDFPPCVRFSRGVSGWVCRSYSGRGSAANWIRTGVSGCWIRKPNRRAICPPKTSPSWHCSARCSPVPTSAS